MFSAKVVVFLAAVAVCYGAPNARLHSHHLRIDGGVAAKIEDYPFVASVQWCYPGCEYKGTGVIINENWVLTAAACVEDTLKVLVGTAELPGNDGVLVDVASSYIYPVDEFSPTDLALLKLATPLTFNDKVQAAKLPTQGQEITGKAVVTSYSYTEDLPVNTLQAADLDIISNADCKKQLDIIVPGQNILDDQANICTLGGEVFNHCFADFGTPVSQDGTVIGTVTWFVLPCTPKEAPHVITKISNYADWIAQTIAAN